ncbi:MAG: DUF6465 family protein [Lachnospiraceae bacterium]|nr:DUF6465 family protein [Lachnospiraceae bacterium]
MEKVFLEVAENQYDCDAVEAKVKADLKKKSRAAIKDLKIYIKPEDGKAYYTANEGKISGDVEI